MNESQLQNLILTALNQNNQLNQHQDTMIFAVKYCSTGETGKGFPDIVGAVIGEMFGIEVKCGSQLSPDQLRWRTKLQNKGCLHFTVSSKTEAINVISFINRYAERNGGKNAGKRSKFSAGVNKLAERVKKRTKRS